ncbi:flagellar brake protein [Anaerosacchariphilus polymeriproducens]|uniref:flagellar brake protein n=1 Tax=Anaerosacchariphilus polymeriproducens TaxID=1812858 RepID=UPI001390674D|nr:flagellar brake domain-containing protein [Anaerosacchariphilus polymeriproducens]
MISNVLSIGDKVEIRLLNDKEHGEKLGDSTRIFKSQIQDITEDDIKMALPIEQGKIILLPVRLRYEFYFYTKSGLYRCEGEIQNRYRANKIYMASVVVKSKLIRYQRREFYRLPCLLDMNYKIIDKEKAIIFADSTIQYKSEYLSSDEIFKGIVVDISGGGLRFISGDKIEAGAYICFMLQIELNSQTKNLYEIGEVISSDRMMPEKERKYEHRIRFVYLNKKEQELIIRYVFETERKKVNKKRD